MDFLPITIDEIVYPVLQLFGRPKALLDRTVAQIYGVETKRINEALARNPEKFPEDFYFELNREEFELVANCDRFGNLKHSSTLPKAFTHFGCNMLATILKSEMAVRRCVQIIRAFTTLEQTFPNLEKLNQLAALDPVFIRAIVNELGDIHRDVMRIEERVKRIEACLLSAPRALLPSSEEGEEGMTPQQATTLREIAKRKGRDRQGIARLWKEFKRHFGVGRYVHLPGSRFQEALEWMQSW